MRREQHRRAGLMDFLEEPEDVDRELRIEVACRLVREEKRGLADDRARDGDALLLAAAEHACRIAPAPTQADAIERFADARTNEPLREPEHLERDRDVLVDRPRRDELEILKHAPDVAPQKRDRIGGEARDVATHEEDATVVDGLRAIEQSQQRRFSRRRSRP